MLNYLRWAAILGLCWAPLALVVQYAFLRAKGHRPLLARPAGDPGRGAAYLLGRGLLPWAQESTRRHLPTFAAGATYHLAVLGSLLFLAGRVAHLNPPFALVRTVTVLSGAGLAAGVGLYLKRVTGRVLHAMSAPDDYISNILVTVFLGLTLACTLSAIYEPWLLGGATVMLLWLPIGKLRHCLYFFLARTGLGAFFGRRGVLPPPEENHA